MSQLNLHLELLDKARAQTFGLLGRFKRYGYLAGGTALALQIAHRHSYDFDIFCNAKISNALTARCRSLFAIKETLVNNDDEFSFLTRDNIKVSFIFYPFSFHGKLLENKNTIPLLATRDIAISKAYTIGRRGSYRDYVDLYFCMNACNLSLKIIIAGAKKVYGELFNQKLFLGQLLYTDDIPKDEKKSINFLNTPISFKEVASFFIAEVGTWQKENL